MSLLILQRRQAHIRVCAQETLQHFLGSSLAITQYLYHVIFHIIINKSIKQYSFNKSCQTQLETVKILTVYAYKSS